MRIIAGQCGGAQLYAPRGMDTRPTQDKVKESLFSIIQAYVPERGCWTCLRAAARWRWRRSAGARDFAALADRDREAVSCIRRNGEKLRFMDAMRIYAGDWRQALSQMKGEERRFDLVFLDPPYHMPVLEECCAALADLGLLEADALLVLEHRLDAVPSPDGRFALWKDRAYGDTAIHFFHYRESV